MASALSVSPALMQAYVSAAAKISRLAVGDPTISSGPHHLSGAARPVAGRRTARGCRSARAAACSCTHVFPLDAEYEFRVGRAGAGFFGLPAVGGDDAVEITLNGERVRVLGRTPPRGGIRLKIPAGPHTIGVAIVRRVERARRGRSVLRARQHRRRERASASTAR